MVFFDNMYTIFVQVLILAVMVSIGVLGDKIGFYTEKAARLSNDLLFYVITPCVIINSFLNIECTKENTKTFFAAFGLAFAFHAVAIIISLFLFNKSPENKKAIYKYATVYGNTGYMGIPLSVAVMSIIAGNGNIGAFYCSAFVAAFNLCCFTHGVWLMSGGKGFDIKKILLNPGAISIIIGVPLFLLKVNLPDIVSVPMSHIANMNTPLAMLMFGTYLSKSDFKTLFKQKNIYFVALFKLALIPVSMILMFYALGVRGNLLIVSSVCVSAPVANNTVMFAAKYDKDTSLASQVSGFTSILAILTMPACVALAISIS